jgi:hypothetical protein
MREVVSISLNSSVLVHNRFRPSLIQPAVFHWLQLHALQCDKTERQREKDK